MSISIAFTVGALGGDVGRDWEDAGAWRPAPC